MHPLRRTFRVFPRLEPGVSEVAAVAVALSAFGLSYGVLAVAAGMSPALTVLSSFIVFGGGSQFAFIGVLAAGGNPMAGAVSGLLLNLRFIAFGLAISPQLPRASIGRRALDSYLIIDESVGLGLAAKAGQVARRFRLVGLSVFVAWTSSTAIGAYGGQLLGDPEVLGLDAALPAGFLALLVPWLRQRDGRVAALLGAAVALALTPIAPPGVPIIAAGLGAVVAMALPATPRVGAGPSEATPPADASALERSERR